MKAVPGKRGIRSSSSHNYTQDAHGKTYPRHPSAGPVKTKNGPNDEELSEQLGMLRQGQGGGMCPLCDINTNSDGRCPNCGRHS